MQMVCVRVVCAFTVRSDHSPGDIVEGLADVCCWRSQVFALVLAQVALAGQELGRVKLQLEEAGRMLSTAFQAAPAARQFAAVSTQVEASAPDAPATLGRPAGRQAPAEAAAAASRAAETAREVAAIAQQAAAMIQRAAAEA